MKIALSQLNYHIGNFERNTEKIIQSIIKAEKQNADLIIFSELCICGYPPQDLLEKKEFINKSNQSIKTITELNTKTGIIIGAPQINNNATGKNLYNSAIFIHKGKIEFIQHKTLLPTYDIFDEYRYFEPNSKFNILKFKNKKIAITICEDLWYKQPVYDAFNKSKIYNVSPIEKLMQYKPDFIVNIAASPYSHNKEWIKRKILLSNANKYKLPIFYVNQVGANTELIFDGGSMVINNNGEIIKTLNYFNEDFYLINLEDVNKTSILKNLNQNKIEKIHNALILGIRDYFSKMNFKHAVIGLSGGIDSAVTAVLAQKALGSENVRVLLMPSKYSSDHSITDAKDLAENLNIRYDIINIEDIVNQFSTALDFVFKGTEEDIAEENIQSRIRGTLLMALSNKFGSILLNTSNKSEVAVGYGTLYGDMSGGLSILGDVYKSEVFELANYINSEKEIIPKNTITKPPSAELKPNQKDTDSLPEYSLLDKILFNYIELQKSKNDIIKQGFDTKIVNNIIKLVNNNEYKRFQTPPILRVSSKGFGTGRRIPLVAKFD